MSRGLKAAFFLLLFFLIGAIVLTIFYFEETAVLSPKGWVGQRQSHLLLLSTFIMLFVVASVFVLTFFIVLRYRASNKKADHHPDWDQSHVLEAIWWGVPFLIICVLGFFTWKGCHELDPFKPLDSEKKPLTIQVVALQWKWLFLYPEQQIATINYLEIPEQVPIHFEITSDAPMNSFWIPDLGGQIYAMAGMQSELHLIANSTGTYRGLSSHLSGEGFSGMTFQVRSSTEKEWSEWVDSVRSSSKPLTLDTYQELAKPTQYEKASFYRLKAPDLFNWILMKYMAPNDKEMNHAQ